MKKGYLPSQTGQRDVIPPPPSPYIFVFCFSSHYWQYLKTHMVEQL